MTELKFWLILWGRSDWFSIFKEVAIIQIHPLKSDDKSTYLGKK